MTYVKQGLGQGEVLITEQEELERPQATWLADAKSTPLTPQPPVPAEDRTPGSGWGGWVPRLCLPPGAGTAWPCEDGERKEMQSYVDRGQGAHRRSRGGRRRGPRDGPWRGARPRHLGAAGRGPPTPGKCLCSSEHHAGSLSSAARPHPAAHLRARPGAPHCPS